MSTFPYTYDEAVQNQIDDAIFQVNLENHLNIHPEELHDKIFNKPPENGNNDKLQNAINVDKKIDDLKKTKLINKKYTGVSVSALLAFSAIYFGIKLLVNKMKKKNTNDEKSTKDTQ
ncbi:conserved Plasmodium protein, unknown function [Plasmodium vinckei vinckei]|uniref:Uncharacterized protein n=1 Tax=Plasmodium vinckei vinckei TaxID=54757 RepID=A0A449BRX4_PLAVN|nr:conserved Plasmodium protein, unknown function [Plasmodium vinckei vinckei]VEV56109.1 conserved Plasmodium protein, unknown function [Plasmodium vinckei vinckei]